MFDGKYFEWNQKRVKGIVDFYGHKFFYFKKLLDLGCGHGDISGVLYRLGADVTAVDCRQEHLKVLTKKYTGVKTVKADLEAGWPFHGKKFDLILDLGLLCHVADFEAHLKAVCASTTHLVLETAVCDSDDPYKFVTMPENKGIYDLSGNGMGCRPSAAAVERVLSECGMNYKRVDNAKYNAVDYVYDWWPKNDDSTSISKRRIWFCVKSDSPLQFQNPNSEIAAPHSSVPAAPTSAMGFVSTLQNSGMPVKPTVSASPKPPTPGVPGYTRVDIKPYEPNIQTSFGSYFDYQAAGPDQIHRNSKEFGLIEVDAFKAPITFSLEGIILPATFNSRIWVKNISPFFPNIKVQHSAITMRNFNKSKESPNVVMCAINNLSVATRIWIEEWSNYSLTDSDISILDSCGTIMTPSILNAQTILKAIPDANVIKIACPWPLFNVDQPKGDYFLYFEKNADLTKALFNSWETKFGNLVVVGSVFKLPAFASFASDCENYESIMKLIAGSKAVIDLTDNNHYMSGLLSVSKAMNVQVITNNNSTFGGDHIQISQDKTIGPYPTPIDINKSLVRFLSTEVKNIKFDESYNNTVNEWVQKLLGFQC
jgi:SAM-dependent methyltransferase